MPTDGSPARPTSGHLRAQSTLPSEAVKPSSPQNRRTKSSQATVQDAHKLRKMRSGASLRGTERGTPGPTHTARKTEYIDNAKFEVLNGSPVRQRAPLREADRAAIPGGYGNRTSYLHTQDGIPVPPPLDSHPGVSSPDLQDSEYDFMHDLSRTSTSGDPCLGSYRDHHTGTVGSSSSNSSTGSKPVDNKLKTSKQKRSSVFSTKTEASKKDGYATGEDYVAHATVSTSKADKEKKRKSYTFGNSFSKAKTPVAGSEHLPLARHPMKPTAARQQDAGDLPLALAGFLRDAKTFDMNVDKVKRLRLLLGSESTR